MRLSFIELLALAFTGLAGVAASVQAYVAWQTREEVANAIIFAERIDACANMLASIEFVVDRADPESREKVAASTRPYYRPEYFLGYDAVSNGIEPVHRPLLASFQKAASAYKIVMPAETAAAVEFFERVVRREVPAGGEVSGPDFAAYLAEIDRRAAELTAACRALR